MLATHISIDALNYHKTRFRMSKIWSPRARPCNDETAMYEGNKMQRNVGDPRRRSVQSALRFDVYGKRIRLKSIGMPKSTIEETSSTQVNPTHESCCAPSPHARLTLVMNYVNIAIISPMYVTPTHPVLLAHVSHEAKCDQPCACRGDSSTKALSAQIVLII